MKRLLKYISFFLVALVFCGTPVFAQSGAANQLNRDLIFFGDHIGYKGKAIQLGPKAFYIDGRLPNEDTAKYKYVYNSVNEAVRHLAAGTESAPMVLYIAPWVYWIDNPDDPEIRVPKTSGGTPFGLEIDCPWLKFEGLSDDPKNVVLASNRGQTMGAKGNFTMFRLSGDGICAENITFGNYCNIDLEYPLYPKLNRAKRGSAIVQAQLVFCDGDKLLARNTRFVSRLNLCPFVGGKRTLFDRCHFESTDDALNGNAVYLNCTFDFYSSKPFWGTSGTGAIFLNCDINSLSRGEQYFVKSRGQVAVIDSRFKSEKLMYLGWKDRPEPELIGYQNNTQQNGSPVLIGSRDPQSTIEINGKPLLDAYRLEYKGQAIYNTYNLLRGDDEWDPMDVKKAIQEAEKQNRKPYTNLPTQLVISPTRDTIETGKATMKLRATVYKFGNYEWKGAKVTWSIAPEFEALVDLNVQPDGSCEIVPTNTHDETKTIIVSASITSGLKANSVIFVSPSMVEAPKFSAIPWIQKNANGTLTVNYKLDMRFSDQSLITWYRCTDKQGSNPVEVAVSRFGEPKLSYKLSSGDIGWYIMAKVEPKHIRCLPGKPETVVFAQAIQASDVKANEHIFIPELKNLSTKYQPEVRPGFYTLDCFAPVDTKEFDWTADNSRDPWYYGKGEDGAARDTGLVQANKGARLRFTPVGDRFGDMKISFTAIPAKTAGQGFSSARQQYMDVFIKYDTKTLTGYALRLVRTTKYGDAIDFILMRYDSGIATPISKPVSADCYRPDCELIVEVKGGKFSVHAENRGKYYVVPNRPEVVQIVNVETEISKNNFGGFGFQHTGTVGSGATLIKDLKIEWQ
jgi:hypothetical protein